MITTILLVTLALLLANALFVAAEFAIVAAPRTAIEHRANQGDRLSRRILAVLSSPQDQDRFIATAQLGITIASLGLGMYGEHTLATWLEPRLASFGSARFVTAHTAASLVAIAALTYWHIFLGEMVPKAIALTRAEGTARAVYWPMRALLVLWYPFVVSLNGIGAFILRLAGVRRLDNMHAKFYTPEELQIIVEESEEGGALRSESSTLIHELFEFGGRTAGEVMVPRVRVVGIPVGASAGDLRRLLSKHRHTRYPVYDGDLDHIVGMLHVKDLLRRLISEDVVHASDVRTIPVIPDTTSLDDVLATMERAHAHMAVVIDEHGGTAGVLSLEDLFEEVVGDIDEGPPQQPEIIALADGSARVSGTVRLDELGHHLGVELQHDDVDSVGGLVLALLDRPPVVGDTVEYGGLKLAVTAVARHAPREVRVYLVE